MNLSSPLFVYKTIFDRSHCSHILLDENNKILLANKAAYKLLNNTGSSITGLYFGNVLNCIATPDNIVCGKNESCNGCQIKNLSVSSGIVNRTFTYRFRYKHNGNFCCKWLEFHINTFLILNKRYFLITMYDISRYMMKNLKLKNKLTIDLATGALNKFSLMHRIDNIIKFQQYMIFTACMIDFDDFKTINDTYGHLTGDTVLEVFSTMSKEEIRKSDFFGRYGGEEFVFIFANTDLLQAVEILQRVYMRFKGYLQKDINRSLTLSCGMSLINQKDSVYANGTELIGHIDKLLYKAKQSGKNKIVSDNKTYYFSV
jgi:diguanylate cyclase (GGDEF)-like protein